MQAASAVHPNFTVILKDAEARIAHAYSYVMEAMSVSWALNDTLFPLHPNLFSAWLSL